MRLLLTGATGFIGRNLLLQAIKENKYQTIILPLRNIDKLTNQLQGEGFATLPSQIVPLTGSAPHWNFDPQQVDHVVHCAGEMFARTEGEFFATNVEGTLNLLERVQNAGKIVILSSQAAAGPCGDLQEARTEADPPAPISHYGKSKLEMEKRVHERFSGRNLIFLRPPMILGPRDAASLPLFKIARGRVQLKPGFATRHYSFISVDDLVDGIFASLNSSTAFEALAQRAFFVTAVQSISDLQLLRTCSEVVGRKGVTLPIPEPLIRMMAEFVDRVPPLRRRVPSLSRDRAREILPRRWVVSSSAFEKAFGWRATRTLRPTLEATYRWYVDQQAFG